MRTLAMILVVIAVVFLGAMGYFWMRDGSLESAGREMDQQLDKVDRTTQPLQDSLGEVGDATKETVGRATDGDDRT
jgi:phage-related minor tail protein